MKLYTIGTSRWSRPAEILQKDFYIPSKSFPGKDLAYITDQAIDIVKAGGYDPHTDPAFVYITAGITDITEKVTYGYGNNKYQEVLFYEEVMKAADRVYEEYSKSHDKLLRKNGIIPIYSSIAPMSFWDWNYARLVQGKTTGLHHIEDYWVMQEDLEECVVEINNRIREMNTRNGFLTPRIGDYVFQKKGAGEPYRFRQNRLVDGVHPNSDTVDKWVEDMILCIDKNTEIYNTQAISVEVRFI